jgi:hypothetical protein
MDVKESYRQFLLSKVCIANKQGFELDINLINSNIKPHNKIMVKWLVEGGRRACFASFGLHKTVTQLEAVRLILKKTGGGKKMKEWKNPEGYSRARWQMDAHGFTRSSGNRCVDPEELAKLECDVIFKEYKRFSLDEIYDFEFNVKIAETLELHGKLPSGFMLLQPQSWSEEVWTDITRMLTLNGSQWSKGKEMHLCPMQFDIADRVIEQMSNPGEIVLDPFAGLFTVPYRAVLKGRIGYGIELNSKYFLDGVSYCRGAEQNVNMPTLFDLIDIKQVV